MSVLEPVTTLEEGESEEEEEQGGIRVESVWSEAEGSPKMKTPPRYQTTWKHTDTMDGQQDPEKLLVTGLPLPAKFQSRQTR